MTTSKLGKLVAVAFVLAVPSVAAAGNAAFQMCSMQANNTWFPDINGRILTDAGWINAFAIQADPVEVGNADVQMWTNAQAAGASPKLNLAFEVNNDPTYDDTDTLIIALDAGGGNFHRIHVSPNHNNGLGVAGGCPAGSFVPA